jgi:multiple sugar transport system ATP-binding protein
MADVSLRNINKVYPGGNQAVFDFNLEIKDKEFIVFVGPSGCGKSTTLRMVAGLEEITSGELYIDGELMNEVPAKNRGIAMVFQSYALYPHMTVYDNIAFGLKLRKVPKAEIKEKIEAVSKTLGLEKYLYRKPKALSGGQRQRVALGRAIVRDAKVYLFDEPLSNLDAKLRVHMRTEIAKLHKNIGATSIYVTHDQIEAMTMASRIVVMKDGHIQQIGAPEEIYANPANMFVGGFIGTPPMNFIKGRVTEDLCFESEQKTFKLPIPNNRFTTIDKYVGKEVQLGIRPEDLYITANRVKELSDYVIDAKVDVCEMLGHETNVHFEIEGQQVILVMDSKIKVQNANVKLAIDMTNAHLFDVESTLRID